MAAGAARAQRPRRRRRRIAAVVALLGALGCGEAKVDAIAVWIDGDKDENGNRGLQIYDAGERKTIEFQPDQPGTDTELLQLGVDNRARGLVASGPDETAYVDLVEGRRGRLTEALDTSREIGPDFAILRSGDAVVREFIDPSPDGELHFGFLPLSSRFALTPSLIASPGVPEAGATWWLYSAADAPVLFWAEVRGAPPAADGRVQAVVYPSEFEPVLDVPVPTVVATGTLVGRGIDDAAMPARTTDGICPDRVCVSPSGRVLTTMADEPCAVWRWRWTDAISPDTPLAPTRVVLPEGCPAELDPSLVATIDDDLIVMDDDQRIFLFDLELHTAESIPKVGEGLARVGVTGRGRVLLYVTFAGQVVRVDRYGPRLISTERSYCTIVDAIRVSPSGNWVAMSCNGQSPIEGGPDGLIMRSSSLGLEQFSGINMRPIAVDDEGNVLLYSFNSDDSAAAPRGLFVLGGDGVLARVDDLEPGPASIALWSEESGRINGRYFDATAIPR